MAKSKILDTIDDESIIPNIPALHELAHELGDVAYVTESFFAFLGIDSEPVHDEIQRANMAKAGGPRRADGKVLKPVGWMPADIKRVLDEQVNPTPKDVHAYYAEGLL